KVFFGFLGLFSSILISCEGLFADKAEKEPLARVGDVFLYREDKSPKKPKKTFRWSENIGQK
ncbi:MAG: hypothetical protein AAGL29_14075, partial [Bacteroidota bacterium]